MQIVDFLDRETAKIDALIGKQEQLIATLREDRTATITHAVTKGLDPDVEMKDPGVEWLGRLPCHWNVNTVSSTSSQAMSMDHMVLDSRSATMLADIWSLRRNDRWSTGATATTLQMISRQILDHVERVVSVTVELAVITRWHRRMAPIWDHRQVRGSHDSGLQVVSDGLGFDHDYLALRC